MVFPVDTLLGVHSEVSGALDVGHGQPLEALHDHEGGATGPRSFRPIPVDFLVWGKWWQSLATLEQLPGSVKC